MHMLSKRDFCSEEMETLLRSRNPTVVVTAHGKVQTNEEAQITRRHACSSIAWKIVLVVPGLSSSSGTSSSSASTSQDSSSSSSSPVLERSDGTAPGNWCDPSKTKNKNEKRDDSRDSGDCLRDLPEWLEEFTDNLEDTVMPVPAYSSRDSDSDRPTKVVSKLRKHSFCTHFPKDRNCEICLRTKMTRAPCRRRTGEALLRAGQFGGLITDDHKR